MKEAFEAMSEHPFVTLFLGFLIIFTIERITNIFNNKNNESE